MTLPNLHTIDAVTGGVLTTAPHGFTLTPDRLSASLLCPLPDGSGVLVEDWTYPLSQSFHVPASLIDHVRAALNLSGPGAQQS